MTLLCFTACWLAFASVQDTPNSEKRDTRPTASVSMQRIRRLAELVTDKSSVCILRFETDVYYGINAKRDKIPLVATAVHLNDDNEVGFHVEGTFSRVAVLRGETPTLGKVNETVPLSGRRGPHRLSVFVNSINEHNRSVLVLAILPEKAKGLLDGEFLGPLTGSDVDDILDVNKMLAKRPLEKIKEKEARALLESHNAWRIYAGLMRLEMLGVASVEDHSKALRNVPVGNVEVGVWELFERALLTNGGKSLAGHLKALFRITDPIRQERVLYSVNEYCSRNGHLVRKLVDVADLQQSLREYRQIIMDDTRRRAVMRELDRFLQLR